MKGEKMFRKVPLAVAFSLLALVIPSRAQEDADKKQPADTQKSAGTSEAVKKAATDDPNYVIGPQDVVDISVWKEPELSRNVPVRPDGKISLPLLNDVQASGLTATQLAAEITEGLKKFESNPQVTVIITTMKSQRFYVVGESSRPGAFDLASNMTVLDALSTAGGFTQFAKKTKIYVLRKEGNKLVRYPFNYKDVLAGKHMEQNILLRNGDTIVVP